MEPTQRETYIIRLWRNDELSSWICSLQHVPSGEISGIKTLNDLTAFFFPYLSEKNSTEEVGLR